MLTAAEEALRTAQQLGVSYAEARYQRDTARTISVKNGIAEPLRLVGKVGLCVRLIVDGALAFASTNTLTKEKVSETVRTAFRMAKESSRSVKRPVQLSTERTVEAEWEAKQKIGLADFSVEEKFNRLFEVESVLDPRMIGAEFPSRIFELSESLQEKYYINTEGSNIRSKVPRVGFWFFLTASGKNGYAQKWFHTAESRGWEALRDWNISEMVLQEAKALARVLRDGIRPPKGELDLILGSEVTGIICHESCGHPQEADRILGRESAQAGESYLKPESIGYRIGTEEVTVVDDPTIPNSYGFYLYDDEGVEAKRRTLIERGRIAGFLHNRETAAELGTQSNAAARSVGFDREPIIRMANTFMLPGDHDFDELLEDVKSGVFMKSFMEWNIDDRRFNQRYIGCEAYLIENGEVGLPVRNPTLEITTPALYGSIDAVGRDVEFEAATCGKGQPSQGAPVWHGGPPVRVRNIRLGGREFAT